MKKIFEALLYTILVLIVVFAFVAILNYILDILPLVVVIVISFIGIGILFGVIYTGILANKELNDG